MIPDEGCRKGARPAIASTSGQNTRDMPGHANHLQGAVFTVFLRRVGEPGEQLEKKPKKWPAYPCSPRGETVFTVAAALLCEPASWVRFWVGAAGNVLGKVGLKRAS